MSAAVRTRLALAVSAALVAAVSVPAQAQQTGTQAGAEPTTLGRIEVVGSRVRGRTAEDTAAPVDVIGREELNATGALEVGQILQMLEPSFNFRARSSPTAPTSLRPATLRSLGPDQCWCWSTASAATSRRWSTQQTIGRGSAAPTSTRSGLVVERIEVLRDGAAAQYGSDAIAGVINIILKSRPTTPMCRSRWARLRRRRRAAARAVNTGFSWAPRATSTSPPSTATRARPIAPAPTACASIRRA